jgi:hypothetical protein
MLLWSLLTLSGMMTLLHRKWHRANSLDLCLHERDTRRVCVHDSAAWAPHQVARRLLGNTAETVPPAPKSVPTDEEMQAIVDELYG